MILFKACPRCQTGDLTLAEDISGKYAQYFLCGHVVYPKVDDAGSKAGAKTTFKERISA